LITAIDLIDHLRLPEPRPRDPVLIALFGLPGSGKSTLARLLVSRLPLALLCTDEIRQRHGLPSGPATHAVMYETAAILLGQGVGIVWDGIHLARRDRDRLRAFAHEHRAPGRIIHVTASDETIRRRLAERLRTPAEDLPSGIFAISPGHLRRIARYLEAPTADEDVLTVDTTDGYDPPFDEVKRFIECGGQPGDDRPPGPGGTRALPSAGGLPLTVLSDRKGDRAGRASYKEIRY
jgi:predicted kinase